VARQPIFDLRQRVFGYELLFRSGRANAYDSSDPTEASSRLIMNALSVHGLDELTAAKQAFINVTRDILIDRAVLALPPKRTVLELLETIVPDPEVVAACTALKRRGYRLALDDFVDDDDRRRRLVDLADIIKIDVLATSPEEQRAVIRRLARPGLAFVAEKVETSEALLLARAAGYQYVQGYFFCRPVIIAARDVPSVKLHYLRLLAEVHQPVHSLWQLEEIIKGDVGLTYKLLRYVNSALFMRARRIESLMEALLQVGEERIKAWASILALSTMGRDKPAELTSLAVTRGKFCELLASVSSVAGEAADAFLMGMFSLLDAIVGRPLPEILSGLSLSPRVTEALLGEESTLRQIHDLAIAHERADWEGTSARALALGIPHAESSALYREAIAWARATCAQIAD
jgi:EAL and modified HD-GYP domain-containing signal transduction protein